MSATTEAALLPRSRIVTIWLVALLVCIAAIPLAALWVAFGPRADMAADFTLVDQDGAAFTLSSLRGHPVVLFFGYTHCPDACPTTLAHLAKAIHSASELEDTSVAFVTVDPERDSPKKMGRYVRVFDPKFIGLTGRVAQLDPVYSAYHVWHEPVPFKHGPDDYSMAHSTAVYYIGRRGDIVAIGNWDDDVPSIVRQLKEIE